MKNPGPVSKTFPWFCLALCLAAFSGSFAFARKEALTLSALVGDSAFEHLEYLLEQKDEMSIIDWAKRLERAQGVRAFQATLGSRTIARGGNEDLLPTKTDRGSAFSFPSETLFVGESGDSSSGILRFLLLQRARPDPLTWGLLSLLSVLSGFVLARTLPTRLGTSPPSPLPPLPSRITADRSTTPPPHSSSETEASLLIDSNYVIRQITPSAATLLGLDQGSLLQRHLLDLSPEPRLAQLVKSGEAHELSGVFRSHPHLKVSLKPVPEGTLLTLTPTA